jgi:hypothetical protein
MPAVYERFHAELKTLHDAAGVPYRYRRFVEAVRDPTLLPPPQLLPDQAPP